MDRWPHSPTVAWSGSGTGRCGAAGVRGAIGGRAGLPDGVEAAARRASLIARRASVLLIGPA